MTNDRVCLKFVTDQQQDLKRIDKLNNLFLTYMCGKDPYADPADEPTQKPASGGEEAAAAVPSDRPAARRRRQRSKTGAMGVSYSLLRLHVAFVYVTAPHVVERAARVFVRWLAGDQAARVRH